MRLAAVQDVNDARLGSIQRPVHGILALVGVSGLFLVACHQGQFRGTGSPCASNSDCVSGFVCVQQQCRISSPGPIEDAGDADPLEPTPADAADADADAAEPDVSVDWLPLDFRGVSLGSGLMPSYPPRPCDTSAPFDPPTLITDLQSVPGTHDVTPRLSRDELTLYFSSSRLGYYAIYSATRRHRTDPFSMPMLLPDLIAHNINYDVDQAPTVTADGLTMYFESNRSGYSLEKSTRPDLASAWSPATQVYSISPPGIVFGDGGPSISPDGKVMYFHSERSGNLDIFRAEASGAGGFGTAFPVAGIPTAFDEARPVFSEDELTLFYASARPDGGAKGAWDIWMTKRKSKNDAFDLPVNVSELNTSQFDDPGWLSADQCDLYFGRGGVNADTRLYVAHRPLKPNSDGGPF